MENENIFNNNYKIAESIQKYYKTNFIPNLFVTFYIVYF